MNIGLDLGYSHTKLVHGGGRAIFPSVVGTPDETRFSLNGAGKGIILTEPRHVAIGDLAIEQSQYTERREDRGWIESDPYLDLMLAALTETTAATHCDVFIVSGLPIRFYSKDKGSLAQRLSGEYRAKRDGRRGQTFTITGAKVIPQGMGALLSVCLDDAGNLVNADLANGRIGLVDIGGKTTGILSVNHLAEIGHQTDSIDKGAWEIVRTVRRWLADNCPDLEKSDHELVMDIKAGFTKNDGQRIDLGRVIAGAAAPLAAEIVAAAGQQWNGGGALDAILLTGGGAHLVGPYIQEHPKFARAQVIAGDPVFANALGYFRFAQRLTR